jgi:4-hydroxy-tetrahydrodipicolinate reductase
MRFLILGRGKTGSQVAEVARERKHHVQTVGSKENADCAALTAEKLSAIDVVIDFTAPHCVVANIEASVLAGKNVVVGTTGWYGELDRIRNLVEQHGTGFVYAANFSVGVNLFFDVARASAAALDHGYSGQIFERHYAQKKDAPSGTAMAIQRVIRDASGSSDKDTSSGFNKKASGDVNKPGQDKKDGLEITSFREGEVIGLHEVVFESAHDRIYLCHDAKSRRGFAEGAVLAAEWLAGKKGFHEFKDIWRNL